MRTKSIIVFLLVILVSVGQIAATKRNQDEAPEIARTSKTKKVITQPAKGIASGVRDVVKSPKTLVSETVQGTKSNPPVLGTVEGLTEGAGKVAKQSVSGATKVATLGLAKGVEVEQPEKSKDAFQDPTEKKATKFKIAF